MDVTREELAELLKAAESAHGEYERDLGERDEDWPTWYAGYILDRLSERSARRRGRRVSTTRPLLSVPRGQRPRPWTALPRART